MYIYILKLHHQDDLVSSSPASLNGKTQKRLKS